MSNIIFFVFNIQYIKISAISSSCHIVDTQKGYCALHPFSHRILNPMSLRCWIELLMRSSWEFIIIKRLNICMDNPRPHMAVGLWPAASAGIIPELSGQGEERPSTLFLPPSSGPTRESQYALLTITYFSCFPLFLFWLFFTLKKV